MPLYEYQCQACGSRFEVIQKFSDPPLEACVKCGGVVEKLVSSPAIQFKGSGWYITDYARAGKSESASDGGAKEEKSDAKAESTTAAKADGKSDSKSETKESKTTTKSESKPSPSATS